VSRPLTVALNAALAALLVVAMAGFVRADKTVVLRVDGQPRTVTTHAADVGSLLDDQGLVVDWRDVVAPSPDASLRDGMEVTVRYARPLDLALDGDPVEVWTTALTVDQALDDLGLRVKTAELSASRSAAIPRSGLAVAVDLPDQVTFTHDGRRTTLLTTAATVRAAMVEAGLRLDGLDRTDTALSATVRDGMVVEVTRVSVRVLRRPYAIDRTLVRRASADLYEGDEKVLRVGRNGRGVSVFRVTVEDGVIVRRVLLRKSVVRLPVDRVVEYGTKARVYAAPGTSIGDLNWAALAQCESGGNPRSVNPAGYYGLYQFSLGTWAGVGGSGNPIDATPAEQLYRAQLLFAGSGSQPWPVCGPLLFT
jgi:uncharacterized protein YabE (DUF348 family)